MAQVKTKTVYNIPQRLDDLDRRTKEIVQGVCLWRLRIAYRTWYNRIGATAIDEGFDPSELKTVCDVLNEFSGLTTRIFPRDLLQAQ